MSNFARVRDLIRIPACMKRLADDFSGSSGPFQTITIENVIPTGDSSSCKIQYFAVPSATDQIATTTTEDVIPTGNSSFSGKIQYFAVPSATDQIATTTTEDVIPSSDSAMGSRISNFLVPSS